jgi:flagellar capping protein FliD
MAQGVNLSSMGMGTGLNTKKLIQKQLQAESKDLQNLQKDSQEAQQRRKLIQDLKGKVEALRSSVTSLTREDTFQPRSASSSDEEVVKASANGNQAVPGSHSLKVENLARAHHHLVGVSRQPAMDAAQGPEANGEPNVKQAPGEPVPTRKTFPAQQANIQSGTYALTINGTEVLTQDKPGRLSPQALAKAINADSDVTGVRAHALDDGRVRLSDADGDAIRITESLPDGQGVTYFGKSIVEGTATQTVPAPEQPDPKAVNPNRKDGDPAAGQADDGQASQRPAPEQGLRGVADATSSEWINSGVTLAFHHGGQSYSYTTDEETTLKSLAQEITKDGNGVVATAVNRNTEDNPHYILSLKSEKVGAGESRITADGDPANPGVRIRHAQPESGEGEAPQGPASLFRHPDNGQLSSAQEVAQSGSDAHFTLDGTHYTRSTNEFSDVIDGVNLTLQGPTGEDGSPAEVQVSHDVQSAVKAVQDMVNKHNKLAGFIDKQTAYDPQQDKAGPLHGSTAVRNVEGRLRSIFAGGLPEGAQDGARYTTLSEVGVRFERNGKLSLETGELQQAIQSHPDDVIQLFAGENGIAQQLEGALEGMTRAGDGVLTSKIDTIGDRIERLQTDMREEQRGLQEREKDLKERYAELEKTISKFQAKKDQMSRAMAKLPGGG